MAENFFHLQSLNTQTAQEVLDETTRRSGKSGSTFTSLSPNNPAGFALSGVTVLFRPFPFEVRNAQAMLTSLEGLSLLALCALSFRRLARLKVELPRRPYLVFGFVYTGPPGAPSTVIAAYSGQPLPEPSLTFPVTVARATADSARRLVARR